MKILALDVSTNLGMALYEGGDPATIRCWGGRIEPDAICSHVNAQITPLILEHQPDLVVAEAPLTVLVFPKKGKDLLGGAEGRGISTAGLLLNRISGAVQMLVHLNACDYEEVQPKVWQAAMLRGLSGDNTKARAQKACELMQIREATNEHKRDAALIALWGYHHSQKKKWIEHERNRLPSLF